MICRVSARKSALAHSGEFLNSAKKKALAAYLAAKSGPYEFANSRTLVLKMDKRGWSI